MLNDYEYSWQLALYSYLFYFVMFLLARPYKNYKAPTRTNKPVIAIFFFFYILLNIFAFWEYDTYHMWGQFMNVGYDKVANEEVYNKLSILAGGDYFIWRAMVWTPACLLMYLTAKKIDMLNNKLMVSIVLFGGFIGYTRGMLGFTMLLFGVVMLLEGTKIWGKIIGLTAVIGSYFFHNSMPIAILFSVLALYPIGKGQIKILLILFPLLALFTTMLSTSFGNILSSINAENEKYYDSILVAERYAINSRGILMKILEVIPQYAALLYMGILIYKQKIFDNISQEKTYKYLFRFTFIGFYISSLFYFTNLTAWVYERFKHIAFFAMIFVFAATLKHEKKFNRTMSNVVVFQLLIVIFTHFLRVYKAIN